MEALSPSPSSSIALPLTNPHNSLHKVSNFQLFTNTTTFIPSWVHSTKPNTLALTPVSSNPKKFASFHRCCSAKPDTSANNSDTDNKPNEEQQQPQPGSSAPKSQKKLSSSESDDGSTDELSPSSPSSCSGPSSVSRGLVFDLGPSNSWDSGEVGSPVVKRFLSDEEERWYMWYHGRPNNANEGNHPSCDLIGLAISSNGVHWDRGLGPARSSSDVGFVMNCGKDWWGFDTGGVRPSEMVVMSSTRVRASSAVYWLYYTGYRSEKVEFSDHSLDFSLENPDWCFIDGGMDCERSCGSGKVFKSLPGLAISQDGRHWARIEGEHHSGALIDVGNDKEWDSLFLSSPQVVFHESGDLRMYYHSFDVEKGQFGVGIARSRDGIRWVKLGKIMGGGKAGSFDESGAMNVCVVRNRVDGNYVMAYEGVAANRKRSIGMAVSPDGLKEWRRLQDEAVLKPSDKGFWDDKDVGSPCLVHMDAEANEWRLYYRGIGNEGRIGIGMAVSEGSDIRSFRRWIGFHV